MRYIEWKDKRGYMRRSLLRRGDSTKRPERGLPAGVPDLSGINWQEVERDLNNELYKRGLFTFEDVQRSRNALSGAVLAVLKRRLVTLYKNTRR